MAVAHAIVGRESELAQLREVVDASGPPHAVFIEGDAGVGKTALLDATAAAAGVRVLRARANAAEAASSYTALHDLLAPAIDAVDALPVPQRRALAAALLLEDAGEPVDPRLVALASRSLLRALDGPVLLAIDDWHWLDAATEAALAFVLRRLEPGGPKVLATVRTGEADGALAALVHSLPADHALELVVGPLDPPSLASIVHARTGEWPSKLALARLHESSAGNPLVALELIRAPGAGTSTDVRRLLARRVATLPPDTRALLRVVAALPEPTVGAVAGDGLEAALAADVLVRDGDRLRFSHPLIAAVVEERTPPAEWRAIHARLAESTVGEEQRARHLAAAADGPDEAVAAALLAASEAAEARGATIAAAELAERAAELTPAADVSRRTDRLLVAATAAIGVEDGPRARRLVDAALGLEPAGAQRAKALISLAYLVDDDSGLRVAESALAHTGDDDALAADILVSASMFAGMGGEMPKALALSEAAVARAEAGGRRFGLAAALKNLAFFRQIAGQGLQRELLLRADALARAEHGHAIDDTPLMILGLGLYIDGDLDAARELLLAELDRAREQGYVDHESFALLLLAELEVRAGNWDAADHYARATLERTLGTRLWNAEAAGRWTRAHVDAHLGRIESAREHADAGRRQAEELGDFAFATRCAHVLGFVALSAGDGEAALHHLGPLREVEARLGIREPAVFCIPPDRIEALVLAGELDAAREAQAELETRGHELGRAWAIATALRCRGLIDAAEGRSDEALAALRDALAAHEAVPQPFDRARTLLTLGTVQRRAKQRADGRRTLEAARAAFEELGAPLWANKARAEIGRLGGRRARDRDELTETERRIAELAAAGRSNREIAGELFVSERTVEANLTRAYRKLGVRSRTELARRLPAG